MTLPDEHLRIDTPENVMFDYEVAGIGSRFLAALVDTLLILILQVIAFLSTWMLANLFDSPLDEGNSLTWIAAVVGLISFALLWGYYVFFEVLWNGQSPGKRWVGLRVIRTDGTPISLAESIIRNLVRLVDFLPVYYGVGVVTMFVNEQARRLGDLAAGTLVVHDKAEITLESLKQRPVPASVTLAVSDLPVERLGPQDIQMAEDYLRRRTELAVPHGVGSRIVAVLYERMELPPEEAALKPPALILQQIVQASRHQDTQGE